MWHQISIFQSVLYVYRYKIPVRGWKNSVINAQNKTTWWKYSFISAANAAKYFWSSFLINIYRVLLITNCGGMCTELVLFITRNAYLNFLWAWAICFFSENGVCWFHSVLCCASSSRCISVSKETVKIVWIEFICIVIVCCFQIYPVCCIVGILL